MLPGRQIQIRASQMDGFNGDGYGNSDGDSYGNGDGDSYGNGDRTRDFLSQPDPYSPNGG